VVVFIDIKWNPKKRQKSKKHVCYDQEKDIFFEADSLAELKDYNEIYLDSLIFPNMWQQLREVIDDDRKVYYFTKPWKWNEVRERFREELEAKIGKVSKKAKTHKKLKSIKVMLSYYGRSTSSHRLKRILINTLTSNSC